MGVLSRTREFHDLVHAISAKEGIPDLGSDADPTLQARSELNVWSAEIGSQIHAASVKVQELRRLVQKRGIFEDRTPQIERLSHDAKQDIDSLNRELEVVVQRTGSGGANSNYQVHASNAVATLKIRVMEVSRDFKEALEERMRAMEQQDVRRNLYSAGRREASAGALPVAPRPAPAPSGSEEDPEAGCPGIAVTQRAHASSRVQAVESIQRTIGEVAQMVQKVAVMVTAQEESVRRIEQDAEDALTNSGRFGTTPDAAQGALLDHLRTVAADRSLIVKVFLILIFFVIFFVVFLA